MEVRRRVSSRLGVWGAFHPSRGHIFEEQSHPPPQGVRPAHLSCEDLDTMSRIVSDAFLISRLFSSCVFPCQSVSHSLFAKGHQGAALLSITP